MSLRVPFTKLVGTGNDFILVDTVRHPLGALQGRWRDVARLLCDRRRGIGADGLLVLGRSRLADVRMRIMNPDGTEPSMCGNGIRCLGWYAYHHALTRRNFSVETKAGVLQVEIRGADRVRIHMGAPRLLQRVIRVTRASRGIKRAVLIDSGVPHLVCWVDDVSVVTVDTLGRLLRHDQRFAPRGANVDFVESLNVGRRRGLSREIRLKMRTYERGVEGETRACGTGAVAAAAAAVLRQESQDHGSTPAPFDVEVSVPGGSLRVSLGLMGARGGHLNGRGVFSEACLEGEARVVFEGSVMWNGRRP